MSLALHSSRSPNFAPFIPLQQAAQRKASDKTVLVGKEWFAAIKQELEQENKGEWDDRVLLWELIFGMIEGNSLGRRGRNGGWRWVKLPQRTDEPVYGYNLMGFYSDNIKAKWTQSNTGVNWRPTSDTDKSGGSAKAATKIHDFYRRHLYTQTFRQAEAMLAQCGKYARYYYYSDESKRKGRRPVVEQQSLKFGDSTYFCPDCGEMGLADDVGVAPGGPGMGVGGASEGLAGIPDFSRFGRPPDEESPDAGGISGMSGMPGQSPESAGSADTESLTSTGLCPHCGEPNAEIQHAAPFDVLSINGYEEFETGDIVCESVPAFELKHDVGLQPQHSPYLIRRRRIRVSVLQAKFPHLQINRSHSEDQGMRAIEDLKSATSGASLGSKDLGEPTAEFVQLWLAPCMYSQQILKEQILTASGITLPEGTRLADVFPDGMYLCWVQGIEAVVEVRNEHHKDFWVGQEYRKRAISALGSGLEDMVEGQRQYNLVMSIIYTQLRTSAMPATLFEQKLLPHGVSAYLGSLSNIPVDSTILEGKSIRDAVHQLQPQPPTGQHFSFAQALDVYLQKASRVTDVGLGQALNLDNRTATGAQLASANAQGLFAPQLALKAEADREGAEIILRLFRKYTPDEVYVALAGKRGELDGMWLSQSDIQTDLFAEVAPDSYLPQTNLERRERWRGFLMDMGGLPGLKQAMDQMPSLVEQIAELYDVDLGAEDYTASAEICFRRIEQMRQAEPMAGVWLKDLPPSQVVPDPATGKMIEVPIDPMQEGASLLMSVLDPPIEAEEIGHLAAVSYLRSWLTEDEGIKASPILRAGVKAMIAAHFQGMVQEAQMTGALGMAGQPAALMPPLSADGGGPQGPQAHRAQAGVPKRAEMPSPERGGDMPQGRQMAKNS